MFIIELSLFVAHNSALIGDRLDSTFSNNILRGDLVSIH
jgi:hypothetical protein